MLDMGWIPPSDEEIARMAAEKAIKHYSKHPQEIHNISSLKTIDTLLTILLIQEHANYHDKPQLIALKNSSYKNMLVRLQLQKKILTSQETLNNLPDSQRQHISTISSFMSWCLPLIQQDQNFSSITQKIYLTYNVAEYNLFENKCPIPILDLALLPHELDLETKTKLVFGEPSRFIAHDLLKTLNTAQKGMPNFKYWLAESCLSGQKILLYPKEITEGFTDKFLKYRYDALFVKTFYAVLDKSLEIAILSTSQDKIMQCFNEDGTAKKNSSELKSFLKTHQKTLINMRYFDVHKNPISYRLREYIKDELLIACNNAVYLTLNTEWLDVLRSQLQETIKPTYSSSPSKEKPRMK